MSISNVVPDNLLSKDSNSNLVFKNIEAYNKLCFVQTALLYSDSFGTRKIRILNHVLMTTNNPSKVLLSFNETQLTAFLVKEALFNLFDNYKISVSKDLFANNVKQIIELNNLLLKRGSVSASIQSLSKYILGFFKSSSLSNNIKGEDVDYQNYIRSCLLRDSADNIVVYCYPRIHRVKYNDDNKFEIETPKVFADDKVLSNDIGYVYLIVMYNCIILFIKPNIHETLLKEMFGVISIDELISQFMSPGFEIEQIVKTDFSVKLIDFIEKVSENSLDVKKIWVIDSINNPLMKKVFVESNFANNFSYSLEDFNKKLFA